MSQATARTAHDDDLFVADRIERFLDEHGLGSGPMQVSRVGEGQSNLTYLIARGEERLVLRRGPRPPVPKSTHDMVREAKIQIILGELGQPVPKIHAVCDDPGVTGAPFYVMDWLDGWVFTDTEPDHLAAPAQREQTSRILVEALAGLHSLDVCQDRLAVIGRPEGYLGRQVERFSALWKISATRELREVEELAEWLRRHLPSTQRNSVVHGDYRLGNLMFAAEGPARLLAVLDWEMATLGDPLADFGYLLATYTDSSSPATPLHLSPVTARGGYLNREGLIQVYAESTGLDLDRIGWYVTLALWKAAVFCEAIYRRWLEGERPEDTDFAPTLAAGVPRLLEAAAAAR